MSPTPDRPASVSGLAPRLTVRGGAERGQPYGWVAYSKFGSDRCSALLSPSPRQCVSYNAGHLKGHPTAHHRPPARRVISSRPRVMSAARPLEPKPRPSEIPQAVVGGWGQDGGGRMRSLTCVQLAIASRHGLGAVPHRANGVQQLRCRPTRTPAHQLPAHSSVRRPVPRLSHRWCGSSGSAAWTSSPAFQGPAVPTVSDDGCPGCNSCRFAESRWADCTDGGSPAHAVTLGPCAAPAHAWPRRRPRWQS